MTAATGAAGVAAGAGHVPALPWRQGLSYGLLGAPLAFVSLPLYVSLPHHYATQAAVPLATLGALLLAVRALDAVVDPALGHWADGAFGRSTARAWALAAGAAIVMALAFAALWHPPADGGQPAVLAWLMATLLPCTLAFSALAIVHQAWGTRWGGAPAWRARVAAWREGLTLAGVLLASALPAWLPRDGVSVVLALLLVVGLVALARAGGQALVAAPASPPDGVGGRGAPSAALPLSPWRNPAFRRLLAVFMVNGIAAAVPATLLPFFVADRLQATALQPVLLLAYFGAAALALPLWVRAVARWGLAPTWRRAMLASVLAFAATPALGAGDGLWFGLICALSGLALGADLALPGALLTGVIHQAGAGRQGEGRYLGWWACATKLNLALAAGLALPLLALAGYRSGSTDAASLQALAWAYGGLPCVLKLLAAALLWRAERLQPGWKEAA